MSATIRLFITKPSKIFPPAIVGLKFPEAPSSERDFPISTFFAPQDWVESASAAWQRYIARNKTVIAGNRALQLSLFMGSNLVVVNKVLPYDAMAALQELRPIDNFSWGDPRQLSKVEHALLWECHQLARGDIKIDDASNEALVHYFDISEKKQADLKRVAGVEAKRFGGLF